MIIKDKYGSCIDVYQAKSGKIIIPIGSKNITLSQRDAEQFDLYGIEDFDIDLFKKAYQE